MKIKLEIPVKRRNGTYVILKPRSEYPRTREAVDESCVSCRGTISAGDVRWLMQSPHFIDQYFHRHCYNPDDEKPPKR